MSARLAKSVEQIKRASLAALPVLLREWLPNGEQRGDEYIALNPNRNDRNLGSFRICISSGKWRDHAIGKGGSDPISLHAYLFTGGDYRAAIKAVVSHPAVRAAIITGALAPAATPAKPAKASATKLTRVKRMIALASDLAGTPAEKYLLNRGLRPNAAWDDLRASPLCYPGKGRHPALIAAMRSLDGSLVAVHRTFLQPNGLKLAVPSPRLTLGYARGSAIQLALPTDELIICEGLEDGLTIYQELGGHPVWVAGGASFLASMTIPDGVRSLTIAADNDRAGEEAAMRAADVHHNSGRIVKIMRPSAGFKDFNDQHQGKTNEK